MGNASLYDWAWLLSYESRKSQLNEFKLCTRSVVPLLAVDWPVVWYLTRYSRKYIFVTSALPSKGRLGSALGAFEIKLAWRYVLTRRDDEDKRLHQTAGSG